MASFGVGNLNTFTTSLKNFVGTTEGDVIKLVDEIVLDTSTTLQQRSPVRTGYFQSQWYVEYPSGGRTRTIANETPYGDVLAFGGLGSGTGSPQVEMGWIDNIIKASLSKF